MFHQEDVSVDATGSAPMPDAMDPPPAALSRAAIGADVVTYELVAMNGREWFSRNRGGGWRTLIDVETGRATQETCFVEDHLFERMLLSGRTSATPVEAATVAERHPWFVGANPARREPTGRDGGASSVGSGT